MCVREWWETQETTPRKLRTMEILLKDVENTQNWWFFCFSYCFPGALTHSWRFFDAPTFYFFFWDQIHTILSTTVDDKGRWDSHWKVRHHAVGYYNFLTQKKKIFHPITPKLDVPLWFVMSSKSLKAWLPQIVSMYAHVPWLFTTLIPLLGGS
jgi:hypothetical protein